MLHVNGRADEARKRAAKFKSLSEDKDNPHHPRFERKLAQTIKLVEKWESFEQALREVVDDSIRKQA